MKTDYEKLRAKLIRLSETCINYEDFSTKSSRLPVKGWQQIALRDSFTEMMQIHYSKTEII